MKHRLSAHFGWVVVLLCLLAVFSYAMFQGGFASWFLFITFLPLALYAILLAVFCRPGTWAVTRETDRSTCQAGEAVTVTIRIQRKWPFPLFVLLIKDEAPWLETGNAHLFFPAFKNNLIFSYQIPDVPRGEHVFERMTIKTGDLLGLVEKEVTLAVKTEILVYPAWQKVLHQTVESGYEQGAAASRLKIQSDHTTVAGIRNYQPGDPFTWIDWKATARMNEIQSKEFEIRQSNDLFLLMDRKNSPNFELLVQFTASLIHAAIRSGGRIGLGTLGQAAAFFPVQSGETHRNVLFRYLAVVEPESVLETEPEPVRNRSILMPKGAVPVVITTPQALETLADDLKRAGYIHPAIVFVIKGENEPVSDTETRYCRLLEQKKIRTRILYEEDFYSSLKGLKAR
ncbi:DUF58 domain-containing protein [Heyndrickxia acidiproducens]|uniref:DUF58 domain-containing protein n=1 Tax=Heyndrickxia acidiproducens TaxID=1121084 RepID=UPI00036080CC|nr:DUF58 domain-containing protein [Heyndrickxia acidiproducens]